MNASGSSLHLIVQANQACGIFCWKMLNRPKEMNAVSAKVLLQNFTSVCSFAPFIFSQVTPSQACFALLTSHNM